MIGFTLGKAMDVTFYVFLGFLVGVTVMCAMVIAVSVKDTKHPQERRPTDPTDSNKDRVVYKNSQEEFYTYNASGQKRKVKNVKYRD